MAPSVGNGELFVHWFNRRGLSVTLLLWLMLAVVAGLYTLRVGEVARTEQTAQLPPGAESAKVSALLDPTGAGKALPLVVVWTAREQGAGITSAQQTAAAQTAAGLTRDGSGPRPVLSRDGEALTVVLDIGPEALAAGVDRVRGEVSAVPATRVYLAGPAAAQADLDAAFADTDGMLLTVALIGVLLILLLVYRSVIMPMLVIASAILALATACALLYALSRAGWLMVDGQVQGIVFVLVIGASSDYALLLVARYKEELAEGRIRASAIKAARSATMAPVLASAATVAGAMMTLIVSALPSSRTLGPAVAIAMACCAATSLTFLPAALLLCGRSALWPHSRSPSSGWSWLARAIGRRPRRTWLACFVLLLAGAAFAPLLSQRGVPLNKALPAHSPSVAAQDVLTRHFPAGTGSPLVILTPSQQTTRVREVAATTQGVADARIVSGPGMTPAMAGGQRQVLATLTDAADSEGARDTVARLRASFDSTGVLVGGQAAQLHDLQQAALQDHRLIVPLVLAVVLLILTVLLRCLLLPVLLVAAASISLIAAFGISALAFYLITGATDTEPAVVLFSVVFLVALGVDYNIFLVHRVRHEAMKAGTSVGVYRSLVTTSSVISAAGLIQAATFGALTLMPLLYLAQLGCIVVIGVLIDTLLVRLFLVPAVILDLGHRAWWPARLSKA